MGDRDVSLSVFMKQFNTHASDISSNGMPLSELQVSYHRTFIEINKIIIHCHISLCAQAIKSHHVALPRCADLAGRWLFLAIWSHLRHFSHYLAQRSKAIRWLLVALRTLSIL